MFGSAGHNFTALYLYDLLSQLDDYYDVEYQPFVETFSGGNATLTVNGEDQGAELMTYAPNGQVEAPIVAVPNLGCEPVRIDRGVISDVILLTLKRPGRLLRRGCGSHCAHFSRLV